MRWAEIFYLKNEAATALHYIRSGKRCLEFVDLTYEIQFLGLEIKVQFLPKKIKGKDYDLSQKEKEELPFLNIITKGKVAKISWIRKNAYRFNQNIMLFAFEQSRLIGKNLNVALTENPQIYRNS